LDVHPPHEPVRSWKDFLLHLLTITIGLFIALTLEAAVEAMHYRHIVRDARVNLRREIGENHGLYAKNLLELTADRDLLMADIEQLRDMRAGKPPPKIDLRWSFGWSSYADSAWKSARDIGAIAHMEPEMLEDYSGIYGQQEYVNQIGAGIILDEAKAASPLFIAKDRKDPRDLQPVDIQALLLASAELYTRVLTLESLMRELDDGYKESLQQHDPSQGLR
jgi:hypothetical protein